MPDLYFQFKRFTVRHDQCAMKVGTDGVLLGAWAMVTHTDANRGVDRNTTALQQADRRNNQRFSALDVGTGTGLIALMIAQRNAEAEINAIDIDHDACKQAAENVERSPFKDRIRVFHQPFLEYTTERKYDLVVSNPPYFSASLKSPDKKRSAARHNDSLPLKLLIEHALTMLVDDGKIALILPVTSSGEIDFIIATHRLYLLRRTEVISVEGLKPKRFLIELSAKAPPGYAPTTDQLILTTTQQERTQTYNHLTKDFYL
ncbi:MAG: methyltransferase [Tannerella sp.]|nr:methyltransferase [Tannerella sp.]